MKRIITKTKLSITLDTEIFLILKEYIINNNTNRSKFIEKLLKEYIDKNNK